MSIWSRIRGALESQVSQRVTRIGLLYTLACLLIALAAFTSANNLLFLILAAMLSTLMISGFVSRLSLAGLAIDLLLPEHVCARRKLTARVVIQNEKRWMSSFSVHLTAQDRNGLTAPLYFPALPAGVLIERPVTLYFEKRGSHRENSFRLWTRFPFGFAERRVNVFVRREVIVYPALDPQPGFEGLLHALAGEMEARTRGQGSDFYRIRPYQALETARHVDWRATAHTGDLQVREFAREEQQTVSFALDLDVGEDQREWLERSVDCCAFLIWNLRSTGLRLRFRTQQTEIGIPEDGDVYTILKYLALVGPARGQALPVPDDRGTFHVVFSNSPERLARAGWALGQPNVRILGPDPSSGVVEHSG